MIEIKDANIKKQIANNQITNEELADYFLKNFDIISICNSLAELYIQNSGINKIPVTQEEFDTLTNIFRIKGYTSTGFVEKRGRKPKEPEKNMPKE